MMLEPHPVKQMPICDVPVFEGSKLSKGCMNSLTESLTRHILFIKRKIKSTQEEKLETHSKENKVMH